MVSNILSRDSQSRRNGIQTAVFDTGAQRTILKEEDVGKYVFDEVDKASVVIVPAAKGSEFNPSRVGMLGSLYPQKSRFRKTHYMAMEVITASSSILQKSLIAYEPFYLRKWQLDIRTPEATRRGLGSSRMWLLDKEEMWLHRVKCQIYLPELFLRKIKLNFFLHQSPGKGLLCGKSAKTNDFFSENYF